MSQANKNLKHPFGDSAARHPCLDSATGAISTSITSSAFTFPCDSSTSTSSSSAPAHAVSQPNASLQCQPSLDSLPSTYWNISSPQPQPHKAPPDASAISAPVNIPSLPLAARSRLPPLPMDATSRSARLAAVPPPCPAASAASIAAPTTSAAADASSCLFLQPSSFWSSDPGGGAAESSGISLRLGSVTAISAANLPGCTAQTSLEIFETPPADGPSGGSGGGGGEGSGGGVYLRAPSRSCSQAIPDLRIARCANLAAAGAAGFSPRGYGGARALLAPLAIELLSSRSGSYCSGAGGGGGGMVGFGDTGVAGRSGRSQLRPSSTDAAAGAEELADSATAPWATRKQLDAPLSPAFGSSSAVTAVQGSGGAIAASTAAANGAISDAPGTVAAAAAAAATAGGEAVAAAAAVPLPPLPTASAAAAAAAAQQQQNAWRFEPNLQRARMQARYAAINGADEIEYVSNRNSRRRGGGSWKPRGALRLLSALAERAIRGKRSFGAGLKMAKDGGGGGEDGLLPVAVWRRRRGGGGGGVMDGDGGEEEEPVRALRTCDSRRMMKTRRARTGLDGESGVSVSANVTGKSAGRQSTTALEMGQIGQKGVDAAAGCCDVEKGIGASGKGAIDVRRAQSSL